tara:strand:+ start:397 stop:1224 length:828 start_codon:yes stop_codon:yes gene_type:complete
LNSNIIKFWGVRGSNPTTDSDKLEVGGDTSCVEVRTADNQIIILDMGTGLRNLGQALVKEENPPNDINIFISHYHWDHILGFLSFLPLFNEKFNINIYGKTNSNGGIKEALNDILDTRFWPVSLDMFAAKVEYHDIEPGRLRLDNGITIESNLHPHPNGALGYRIELKDKIVTYVTDIEHPIGNALDNVSNLSRESDVLIHEAHFTPEDLPKFVGWGHSSWEEAVDIAKSSNSKQLILFHHSPTYSDEIVNNFTQEAKKSFDNVIAAKQGLTIKL